MVRVNNHHTGDPDPSNTSEQGNGASPEQLGGGTVGTVEHCTCGLLAALVTATIVGAFYPALLSVIRPFELLSSTTLVVALAATWILLWLVLELLWEWRAGRLHPE